MHNALDLAVDALATLRITRLITVDSFPPIAAAREKIQTRYEGKPVAELVGCPHCAGVWVAGGVMLARRVAPRWWSCVAVLLALAAAPSLAASAEDAALVIRESDSGRSASRWVDRVLRRHA